jgi:tetratricopeptide (TPR) repeat protein
LSLALGLLAVLSVRQVGNPDVGFHLKAGEYLLSGRGWPDHDPFTVTMRDHPYIDTSWGYQVAVAAIQKGAGPAGLVLFHALLVLATFFVLLQTARLGRPDPLSAALFLFLAILASEMRFEARPELLSYLFLAAVLHLLHRRALSLPSPLWILPPLFLLWANCHSLFILGWAAIACFAAGSWILRRRMDRALLTWGAGSAAVTMINPYGLRGVLFPFTLASRMQAGNAFGQSIGEFVSPFALKLSEQFPFYPKLPINSFRLLAVLALLSLPILLRRKRWDLILLILAFCVLAAGMIRNMPLLAMAAFPALSWAFPSEGILRFAGLAPGGRRWAATAGLAILSLGMALLGLRVFHDAYYIASRRPSRFGLGWNRQILPLGAAEFALKAGLGGGMLNHLNFGGTLMWKLPQPVFIDGRLEVVGEAFYKEYRKALESEPALEAAVSRYGIEWLVFPYAINAGLLKQLSRDNRWQLAYVDDLSVIFVRQGTAAAGRVDPHLEETLGKNLPSLPVRSLPGLGGGPRQSGIGHWGAGLFRREEFPSEDFGLGLFHFFRGEPLRAERRFAAALRESGGAYYEIYADLAATLYWQHRFEEARDCDRIVLEADPGNRLALDRLSRSSGH